MPDETGPTRTEAPSPDEIVREMGPYHLLQKIGEGGMGEVWLAEQSSPVRRRVAVKIIKRGMDTAHVIARFEAERQALALMEHGAIAKVFDAGETPRGRPYFVMEYVAGVPITEHCDRHRLSIAARLGLFMQVCDGVQHAHQKAVLHRDLKPSNVLVTIQDGKAVPKIIDFGVAKATGQRLTEKTVYTGLGVLIGTPGYMSPEQAEMTGQDVDTRTDVYSLGVILYELLVGALPFEPQELRENGFDEIRRKIREDDPPRPSTRVTTLGPASTESARRRGTDPTRLASQLRGDLDWITMKALEKDRTRRYGSPSELAADVARHLGDEPVAAGPPGAAYRTRKFVRRHRAGVSLAALFVVVLGGFAATMTFEARRIARERDRADRVAEFLTGLFKVSDPSEARGSRVTARELLDKGAKKIGRELADQPELQAQMAGTMGNVYVGLGLYGPAESLLSGSLETRRRLLGRNSPETLESLSDLAVVYYEQGRYSDAEKLFLETLEARRRVLGAEHRDTLRSVANLANVYEEQGRYPDAEKLFLQTLEARRRVLGREHPDTLQSMHNLALTYREEGRYRDAEALDRETLEIRRRVLGADHPATLGSMNNLANVYADERRNEEAERLYGDTIEIERRVLGPDHPDTLATMQSLTSTYRREGRYPEAETLILQVLESQRRVLGKEHPDTLASMNNLANLYRVEHRYPAAEKLYLETIEAERRALGPEQPNTVLSVRNLAGLYRVEGRYPESEKLYLETLEIQRRVLGRDHPEILDDQELLATVYEKERRYPEAEKLFLDTLEARRRTLGADHEDTLACVYNLACLEALRGAHREALDYLRQAVEHGYSKADLIARDSDLVSLHGDPAFDAIVADARKRGKAGKE